MGRNMLSYVDFSKIYIIINSFPELKQNIINKNITVPPSSTSREIEWLNKNLLELESYLDQIITSLYDDFTINKICFKDTFVFYIGKLHERYM